jgi:hypothetical protein
MFITKMLVFILNYIYTPYIFEQTVRNGISWHKFYTSIGSWSRVCTVNFHDFYIFTIGGQSFCHHLWLGRWISETKVLWHCGLKPITFRYWPIGTVCFCCCSLSVETLNWTWNYNLCVEVVNKIWVRLVTKVGSSKWEVSTIHILQHFTENKLLPIT